MTKFMGEIIKGTALICAWYNKRFEFEGPMSFQIEDFKVLSYEEQEGNWSLTVFLKTMPSHYFLAAYNKEARETTVSQYGLVHQDTFTDEDLENDDSG